ncbi:hypothetical protein LCGC14_0793740 [marine sediment metagenome]|uniref:histidine kinase n=1 Tax=marine sediment metagenome TaxID=412755 RepID=A0A0F9SBQ2_9ZZZZ
MSDQKLRETEEKFRKQNIFLNNIIESLTHPLLVINVSDYTIKYANSTASSENFDGELFCYSLAHNRKKPCEYPCVCPLTEVIKTKKSCTVEHLHYDKEGNARIYEIQGIPLLDEDGNVVQLIEYAIDITECKNADQISIDTEKKYKLLFEQTADAILLIDTETGDFVDFNDQMNEILGYTREEFKNLKMPDLDLIENSQEHKTHIDKIIRNGSDIFETQYLRKNGEIRDILVNAKSIKISDKYYLQSILRDITDIKEPERQLKEPKKKLSYVRNNISIILSLVLSGFYLLLEGLLDTYIFHITEFIFQDLFTIDPHEIYMRLIPIGLILFTGIFSQYLINAQRKAEDKLKETEHDLMERVKELTCLYGISDLAENPDISTGELIQGVLGLIPPAWQFPEITCARITLNNIEYKTENFKITEWKLSSRVNISKKVMEIEVYYLEDKPFLEEERSLIKDIGNRLKGDIDRKEAEQELLRTLENIKFLNQELQQFAYVASHDLQEPLRMVISFTQLLAKKYEDKLDDDAKDYINYAVDGARRMQTLINDLLSYSRITTHEESFKIINIENVLEDIILNLQIKIKETSAKITYGEMPSLFADRTQLMQLFQNLIVNALRFRRKEPPQVHISVQQTSNEWIFSVKDNGIGIDQRFFKKIFIIFQRLHTRAEYPGSGIGLAICKRIVDRLNGRIWIESEVGKGSTFKFTIPLKKL